MNKILTIFIVLLSAVLPCVGQVYSVDTLMYNGSIDQHINVVILGDGFDSTEQVKYQNEAKRLFDSLFNATPYKEYRNHFNVFSIPIPSNVSGAGSSPSNQIDNYFGSTFGIGGTDRCVFPNNTAKVSEVLAANTPFYDEVLMLVNSTKYGGCATDFIGCTSLSGSSGNVLIHEFGHSFARLADEYVPSSPWEAPNMTQELSQQNSRWSHWLGKEDIGFYTTGQGTWKRPHQSCKMRVSQSEFCAVCREETVEKIHYYSPTLKSYSPDSVWVHYDSIPLAFKLDLIHPNPNTLKTDWTFNGKPYKKGVDSLIMADTNLSEGSNLLTVMVQDTSRYIKKPHHFQYHFDLINWRIQKTKETTGYKILDLKEALNLKIFPNPVNSQIVIELTSLNLKGIKVEICSMTGNTIIEQHVSEAITKINLSDLSSGSYILKVSRDGQFALSESIIKL